MVRVAEISDPASVDDPQYIVGLHAAVSAALDYALAEIEQGGRHAAPIPPALLAQARQAAGNGVSLEVVMRRCIVGHALLGDFIIEAIEENGFNPLLGDVRQIWKILAAVIDRVIAAMSDEYANEVEGRTRTVAGRRMELVRMLLAGQLLDVQELEYEFDAWHVGVVATGPGASAAVRELAAILERRLLLVSPKGEMVWAWLGGRQESSTEQLLHLSASKCPPDVSLSLGEPARGIAGWRCTHRQAKAAIVIAHSNPPSVVRYLDVALLASALRDGLLADSLARAYLDPLAQERDGGAALRLTLRAYFAAGRNVSSAAAALKVSRQTVNSRLRTIEERIGRSIGVCASELDTALRLQALRI